MIEVHMNKPKSSIKTRDMAPPKPTKPKLLGKCPKDGRNRPVFIIRNNGKMVHWVHPSRLEKIE